MYISAKKLDLDYDVILSMEEEIRRQNGNLGFVDSMTIIENQFFSKANIHYTDRFYDFSHFIDEDNGEVIFIVRFHDQNKYPHDFFGKEFSSEDDGDIISTEKTIDQIMLYHFKHGRADVYLFPLNPPKCKSDDEIMYDKWSTWERKIHIDGSRIEYKLTADFWDSWDYNDHTNFTRSTGFHYDFVNNELRFHS